MQASTGFRLASMSRPIATFAAMRLVEEGGQGAGCTRHAIQVGLVGAIVAKAASAPLPQVVARWVTQPLQMQHTRFAVRPGVPLAVAYADGKPQPIRMTENMVVPLAAGQDGGVRFSPLRAFDRHAFASGGAGMVGNAGDYLQLLESVRRSAAGRPGLVQPKTAQEMVRDQVGPQAQTQGPGWGFGLDWAVLDDPALAKSPQGKGSLQWGGAYGHNWFVDPERRLSVILLTNTAFEGMSGRLVNEVRDAVYASL